MVSINLYRPKEIDLTINFPTEWNELCLGELHLISKHFLTEFALPLAAKAAIFIDILKSRVNKLLPTGFAEIIDINDLSINGLPLVDFIYTDNTLTKQPYHYLRIGKVWSKKLLGPQSNFDNITCGEFEDAEIFYHQFTTDPSPTQLAHLAAILYRQTGIAYINYIPKTNTYKVYDHEAMVGHFLKMPPWVLYTIFIWYGGCRNLLLKIFPTVFSMDEKESATTPDILSFTKCIHAAAGEKNGRRENIRCMLLKELFFDMELEAIKAKELYDHK